MLAGTGETTHIIHYTTGACSFDYVISEYDIPGCNICKQGVTLCHCEDSSCIPWFKDVLNGLSTSFFLIVQWSSNGVGNSPLWGSMFDPRCSVTCHEQATAAQRPLLAPQQEAASA